MIFITVFSTILILENFTTLSNKTHRMHINYACFGLVTRKHNASFTKRTVYIGSIYLINERIFVVIWFVVYGPVCHGALKLDPIYRTLFAIVILLKMFRAIMPFLICFKTYFNRQYIFIIHMISSKLL